MEKPESLRRLREREPRFGGKVLSAFITIVGALPEPDAELNVLLRDAKPGMRLLDEIHNTAGALLVPIGFEISERFLERIAQVAPEALGRTVRVTAPQR
jgi:hypothetical protein